MPLLSRRNLILVFDPELHGADDFRQIASRIAARAPDVRPFVVLTSASAAASVPLEAWRDPTLTVAFGPSRGFRPARGPVIASRQISKIDQYTRFRDAGIATPATALFSFGMELPEAEFGTHVVLKPVDLSITSYGDFVQLMRTARARALTPRNLPPDHPAQGGRLLVQAFVDTGPHPARTRVLTLFGEPLYAQVARLVHARPALESDDATLEGAVIATNAAAEIVRSIREIEADDDPGVVTFARRIAAVFPDVPLLGIDILRRYGDGALFALEVNAGGNTWHFSSPTWAANRAAFPAVVDEMYNQFNALDTAARTLIAVTRTRAR